MTTLTYKQENALLSLRRDREWMEIENLNQLGAVWSLVELGLLRVRPVLVQPVFKDEDETFIFEGQLTLAGVRLAKQIEKDRAKDTPNEPSPISALERLGVLSQVAKGDRSIRNGAILLGITVDELSMVLFGEKVI